jgi:hypothetical protein
MSFPTPCRRHRAYGVGNYLVSAGGYAAAHSYAPELSLQDAYDRAMRELVFEPLGQ